MLVTAVSPASVASIQVAQLALAPARGPPTAGTQFTRFTSTKVTNTDATPQSFFSFLCAAQLRAGGVAALLEFRVSSVRRARFCVFSALCCVPRDLQR